MICGYDVENVKIAGYTHPDPNKRIAFHISTNWKHFDVALNDLDSTVRLAAHVATKWTCIEEGLSDSSAQIRLKAHLASNCVFKERALSDRDAYVRFYYHVATKWEFAEEALNDESWAIIAQAKYEIDQREVIKNNLKSLIGIISKNNV